MVVTVRVGVAPSLYGWALERSGADVDELHRRFPKLAEWEAGDRRPTLKQLEGFARATRTPVGYFFMSEPPEDAVPLPARRQRLHPSEEPPLRLRFLSRVLGLARSGERVWNGLQHRAGRRRDTRRRR